MKKRIIERVGVLRFHRSENAKRLRRVYGDNSGMIRFQDKALTLDPQDTANTLTSGLKDNLIIIVYGKPKY